MSERKLLRELSEEMAKLRCRLMQMAKHGVLDERAVDDELFKYDLALWKRVDAIAKKEAERKGAST